MQVKDSESERTYISWRQAAFIGVGSMVGAGIFSLLAPAGEVAGAAVWLSFLIAGGIAALQGYSFAKFGARYPSAAGLLEYIDRGFGGGHITGISAWMTLSVNSIVTAMVAASFGSYASALFAGDSVTWSKIFAVLVVLVMSAVNIAGSKFVARAQTLIVYVVLAILVSFAVIMLTNLNRPLLAPSGYPPLRAIVSSVALTFFAFLGFGIVTFTAKDLKNPARELPRSMSLAIGIATVIYIAIAVGVFGTLTVEQVVAAGATALAVAAQPILGNAGYVLMSVTGLFATAGATNGGLYPAGGLSEQLASTRQFPPIMGRKIGGRAPMGLVLTAAGAVILTVGFGLTAIASIGSAAALLVFLLTTLAHLRVRSETGARLSLLLLAAATTGIAFLTFVVTTLDTEPASVWTLVAIILLSVALDFWWKRRAGAAPEAESTTT
jgi:amino acid transporter